MANLDFEKVVETFRNAQGELAEIEPRPVAVALNEAAELINRHIDLPDKGLSVLIAIWCLGTYCFELFFYCGYLALRSATPRCGKTRLLRLIAALSFGFPPILTSPSAASIFRSSRKVLILDEVDKLRNQDKEAYGKILEILNAGFEKGSATERVERTKGGGFEIKQFNTFGPKALGGIETLADTLSDRTFQIQMVRTPTRRPRLNMRKLEPFFLKIREDFKNFAETKAKDLEGVYDELPDQLPALAEFDDRLQDISEPLMVIAAVIDQYLPEDQRFVPRLVAALKVAAGRREPSGREREFRAFLSALEPRLNGAVELFLSTSEILTICQQREDLSRIETGRTLSGFLKNFDLFPTSTGQKRGYAVTREWFDGWMARYREKA